MAHFRELLVLRAVDVRILYKSCVSCIAVAGVSILEHSIVQIAVACPVERDHASDSFAKNVNVACERQQGILGQEVEFLLRWRFGQALKARRGCWRLNDRLE